MTCGAPPLLFLLCTSLAKYIILFKSLILLLHFIQVSRHGPSYPAHDITKGHTNLPGTPPGHAHSPALSQVSVPTASPYRYPKGWEAGGGVSLSLWPPSSSLHFHVHCETGSVCPHRTTIFPHLMCVKLYLFIYFYTCRHPVLVLVLLTTPTLCSFVLLSYVSLHFHVCHFSNFTTFLMQR